LTKQLNVTPCVGSHKGGAGRTEQTKEIPSRGTILQLSPLLLDQLRSDSVSVFPILPEVDHPRTLVPLRQPCSETLWGPPEGIRHEYTLLGRYTKCSETMKVRYQEGSGSRKGREPYTRFVYDFVNSLSVFSKAPKSYSKAPAPMLGSDQRVLQTSFLVPHVRV